MNKNKFLILVVFALFVILPIEVNAENEIDNITMILKDIAIGSAPETSINISSPHLQNTKINLTWYQSTNGENYTLMDENNTFDYNMYYKIVFDKTFEQISESMDEGWECGNIQLEIYDDYKVVDTKIFNSGTNTLEYIYDPIWKYNITTELEGLDYDGPKYIIEGEQLLAELIPRDGYRLPNDFEVMNQFMVYITTSFNNITASVYEANSGSISIEPEDIKGDIHIVASGVEVAKVTLDANGGTFDGADKYIIEKWDNTYYDTLTIPTRDGYTFIGYYTEKTGGTKFEMILNESGIDSSMTFYAQWEKKLTVVPSIPEEQNPKTFDGVVSSLIMVTISLIGIVGTTIYLKKEIK